MITYSISDFHNLSLVDIPFSLNNQSQPNNQTRHITESLNLTDMEKNGFTNAIFISIYLLNFVLLQNGLCLTWVAFLW